jgi:hypothetical protein
VATVFLAICMAGVPRLKESFGPAARAPARRIQGASRPRMVDRSAAFRNVCSTEKRHKSR